MFLEMSFQLGESFALTTLLDAKSMKKAIIVTDVNANREAVGHDKAGLLVLPEAGALTGGLLRFLERPKEVTGLTDIAYRGVQ